MKITKRKLQKLIKENLEHDEYPDSIEENAGYIVDEIVTMPGWTDWDENRLIRVVTSEIGNLVPMPLDDDWPDLEMEVMAMLDNARNNA